MSLEPNNSQDAPEPDPETSVSRVLTLADALIDLSRQERERLEKLQVDSWEAPEPPPKL